MGIDVIIIGAGASGLVAAIAAARQGCTVLVIEHKEKAGKKILATGNGKCNYTNLLQTAECYRSEDSSFPSKVLSGFDISKTIQFFEELGIYPKERNGYLYPNSEQAASIVHVLMMECERLSIKFRYNENVVSITEPNYTVLTEQTVYEEPLKETSKTNSNRGKQIAEIIKHTYYCKNLILSTGGQASAQLGSDGSGYEFAKKFGHNIIKPLPALVQLKSPEKFCKSIAGVRTNARVIAIADHKPVSEEEGEILFTDYGISGIPIMQISRFLAKALDQGEQASITIDFLPDMIKEKTKELLMKRINQQTNMNLEEMLVGLFNNKLAYVLLKQAKLDTSKKSIQLSNQEIDSLVEQIKGFQMIITDTNSFENAQVSAGGVSTKEIEEATMESKLSPNLYITGELIDVDGTCGGYNLQWAWSTGYLAGSSIHCK